jgi:hypothetical protein
MLVKIYGVDRGSERRYSLAKCLGARRGANHAAAVSLHDMYYSFVRIHQTPKVTPAMAAGVTDRLWESPI